MAAESGDEAAQGASEQEGGKAAGKGRKKRSTNAASAPAVSMRTSRTDLSVHSQLEWASTAAARLARRALIDVPT